jgi:hypothetical protein
VSPRGSPVERNKVTASRRRTPTMITCSGENEPPTNFVVRARCGASGERYRLLVQVPDRNKGANDFARYFGHARHVTKSMAAPSS